MGGRARQRKVSASRRDKGGVEWTVIVSVCRILRDLDDRGAFGSTAFAGRRVQC